MKARMGQARTSIRELNSVYFEIHRYLWSRNVRYKEQRKLRIKSLEINCWRSILDDKARQSEKLKIRREMEIVSI